MTPIKIYSPLGFSEAHGGVCALYQLRDELILRGCDATVEVEPNHMLVGMQDRTDAIAVVPECYFFNPTPYSNVVRWILYTPSVDGIGYGKDERIYLWARSYRYPWKSKPVGQLFTWDTHLPSFYDRGLERSGTCYLIRKRAREGFDIAVPAGALCIDDYAVRGGHGYLVDVFNRYARFICYDTATQLSTYAALCGCETVLVPDWRVREQAIADSDTGLAGVAWGLQDLDRAHTTLPELPERLRQCELASAKAIDELARFAS